MDAFQVAIVLTAADKITPALALISDRLKTTGIDAAALEIRLKALGGVALAGSLVAGAGFSMFGWLKEDIKAASAYEQAFARFKQLNLGKTINDDANDFASSTEVFGTNAATLLDTLHDLQAGFSSFTDTKQLAPLLASLNAANAILYGPGQKIDIASLEKAQHLRGVGNSPAMEKQGLDLFEQAQNASGGKLSSAQWKKFANQTGPAFKSLSDIGLLKLSPELRERKGRSGAGRVRPVLPCLVCT